MGFGLAAGVIGGAIAASTWPAYGYGYGYGYPRYYAYGYPAYSYGYYPRRAYYGYASPSWGYGYYPVAIATATPTRPAGDGVPTAAAGGDRN